MINKVKYVIVFLIIIYSNSFSQNISELDSLYNIFLTARGVETGVDTEMPAGDASIHKCGLNIVNSLKFNIETFSPEKQLILNDLLERPAATHSLITPGGKFKIHYNPTGPHSPGYNLNLLAAALDSVYNFEIEHLGYLFPQGDSLINPNGSYGGDNRYDIYIQNLSGSLYGYTQFETEILPGSNRFTSFMVIDNNFSGYYTEGIDGARVTVAHEFHHAIQGGSYKIIFVNSSVEDLFMFELTSTAMEEFVFDSIDDYYAYMPDYFQSPSRSFPLNNGYNLAIWNIFLNERFGFDLLKRQWELMPTNRALSAISKSIDEQGSVFEFELTLFGVWSYFTNYRSISGLYFEEAAFYPALNPTIKTNFNPPSRTYTISGHPAANYFLRNVNSSNNDTIVSVFGNGDYQKALGSSITPITADYTLYSDNFSGNYSIGEFYSALFNSGDNHFWRQAEIINNIALTGDSIVIVKDIEADIPTFPSPYRYNDPRREGGESISFPVKIEVQTEVDVSIFTVSMDLVNSFAAVTKPRSIKDQSSDLYKQISVVEWNKPVNEKGENLASGIYIYVVKDGNDYKTGKFVIFND